LPVLPAGSRSGTEFLYPGPGTPAFHGDISAFCLTC
jgi:hypothetical protein